MGVPEWQIVSRSQPSYSVRNEHAPDGAIGYDLPGGDSYQTRSFPASGQFELQRGDRAVTVRVTIGKMQERGERGDVPRLGVDALVVERVEGGTLTGRDLASLPVHDLAVDVVRRIIYNRQHQTVEAAERLFRPLDRRQDRTPAAHARYRLVLTVVEEAKSAGVVPWLAVARKVPREDRVGDDLHTESKRAFAQQLIKRARRAHAAGKL